MSRVVYRCRECRELVPEGQDCVCGLRQYVIKAEAGTESKLAAAYHLARGSYWTAKDHGIRLETLDSVMSDEMKHLAANFLRISELLVEAGYRQ